MLIALHILLGVLVGAAFVFATRTLARRHELNVYAAGLVAAALVYVVFAVANGAPGRWLVIEFTALAGFSLLALSRLKSSPLSLAALWAAHALWDLLIHADAVTHAGGGDVHIVPDWYRLVCAGFDFALAAYLLPLSRRATAHAR